MFSSVLPAVEMPGLQLLACLGAVLLSQTGCVCGDTQFLERHEGGSVTLPCVIEQRNTSPLGVYLKRSWLRPSEVLFMLTESEFTAGNDEDKTRISISGDPSGHSVNVTISQLSVSDTDRYYCEFVVENPSSVDEQVPGKTEFFLLVNADAPGSADVGLVETCAGGSAVLPCLASNGEGLAVEGVSLKRQRGRAPVEMLYHSKRHHGSSSPSSSSSQFPAEKVQLTSAPGPGGITFNLTLQQLQADDSGLYSCQLLLRGRPDGSTGLGRQVFFLSVQAQCGCSSYSTLLYVLSSAVAVLLLLLLLGFVVICKVKSRRRVITHTQAPIYEEMAGVQAACRKLPPCQEEMEPSEYRNCPVKKSCPENHYESPSGALCPRRESEMKY
ncbi:cd7 antigen-like [Chaetodon trifascialis]|uniref:cd7 antigen-like n=1 Tax=Chaetodon trifascialis TaxID=109706 RepID=UPI00399648A9